MTTDHNALVERLRALSDSFRGKALGALLGEAADAIATLSQPEALPGWRLVPIEPTVGMLHAFWLAGPFPEKPWIDGYRAMLAATPEPPAAGDQSGS
jgi:hypothetical protein